MSLVGRLDSLLSRILIMMAPLEQQSQTYVHGC
eukprot:SAG31_NODE_37636_length_302_cov_1.300493_1_plen_32_part_01